MNYAYGKGADFGKHWIVRNFNIFSTLTLEEQELVGRMSSVVNAEKNSHICMAGVKHTHLYIVKEGFVKLISSHPSGKRLTLAILQQGEMIGGDDLLDLSSSSSESAEAIGEATLLAVPIDLIRNLMMTKPELTIALTKEIDNRRANILNRMQDILFLTVPQRLARLILNLHKEFPGTSKSGRPFVNFKLTHAELADLIGSNREAVSATFVRWKSDGPASMVRGYLTLRNPTELERIGFPCETAVGN